MTRRHRTRLLVIVVMAALVLDAVATAAVFVDRRDAEALPPFKTAPLRGIDWDVEPYASAGPGDGFTVTPGPPAQVEPDGTLLYRDGGVWPALNASYAIAAVREFDRTGEEAWLQRARTALDQVLAMGDNGFLPHTFPDDDAFGNRLPEPWYSAASQGLVLSALTTLYEVTGDEDLRAEAAPVFRALTTVRGWFVGSAAAPDPWLDVVDSRGQLWFERWTRGEAPAQILSDESRTLLGVYDFARVLARSADDRRTARALLAGGLSTLRDGLPKALVPHEIEFYSLAARSQNFSGHDILERDLGSVSEITRDPTWERYRDLLDRVDDLPLFGKLDIRLENRDVDLYSVVPDEEQFEIPPSPPATVAADGGVDYRGSNDPARSASYALALLSRYEESGDQQWLARAVAAVDAVLARSDDGLLPYRYPATNVYGGELPRPWFSAEGQGLTLSALVRLHEVTGDGRWLREAAPVFQSLTRVRDFQHDGQSAPTDWLSYVDDSGYLWFEQFAGGVSASLVVPGHLTALLGVYDYWRVTRDVDAKQMFVGGASTMLHWMPDIRSPKHPDWYAVGDKSSDPRYDAVVTRQLEQLAAITDDPRFREFAAG